jgi:pimeloyl-ACP methyl ester carboxylesterase
MKLIGLHAHLQNAQRFKGQVGSILRHLKKLHVEVVFINAPYPVPGSATDFTWVGGDSSLAESHRAVLAAKTANPDAVGLFAFSMGAMLALHIAACSSSEPESPFAWVTLIIAAAAPWPPDGSPLADRFPCRCETPILFVIGRTDQVARPDLQRRYIQFFPNADVFEHDGGHYIPGARGMLQRYTDFFAKHADIAAGHS